MYVFICVHIRSGDTHLQTHMYACMQLSSETTCVCVGRFVCLCVYACVCVCGWVCACVYHKAFGLQRYGSDVNCAPSGRSASGNCFLICGTMSSQNCLFWPRNISTKETHLALMRPLARGCFKGYAPDTVKKKEAKNLALNRSASGKSTL